MKIDVGEGGTRPAGAAAAPRDHQIHGYGGGVDTGVTRSDAGSNRAVAVAQEQAAAAAAAGTIPGKVEGDVGGTSLPAPNGIISSAVGGAAVAPAVKIVTLSAQQQRSGNNLVDGTTLVGSNEYQVCVYLCVCVCVCSCGHGLLRFFLIRCSGVRLPGPLFVVLGVAGR